MRKILLAVLVVMVLGVVAVEVFAMSEEDIIRIELLGCRVLLNDSAISAKFTVGYDDYAGRPDFVHNKYKFEYCNSMDKLATQKFGSLRSILSDVGMGVGVESTFTYASMCRNYYDLIYGLNSQEKRKLVWLLGENTVTLDRAVGHLGFDDGITFYDIMLIYNVAKNEQAVSKGMKDFLTGIILGDSKKAKNAIRIISDENVEGMKKRCNNRLQGLYVLPLDLREGRK
ncbi:MAG: hypothetical protein M1610_00970 [Nitrospirae bacterium]|nr:hypothetical protein [Nitrospirota bacterium]MDA8338365.1 hypothetical protein [Nitrospiraceae bacterium]